MLALAHAENLSLFIIVQTDILALSGGISRSYDKNARAWGRDTVASPLFTAPWYGEAKGWFPHNIHFIRSFGVSLLLVGISHWTKSLPLNLDPMTLICGQSNAYSHSGRWGYYSGLILGLRPTKERRRYKVTPSRIGRAQS